MFLCSILIIVVLMFLLPFGDKEKVSDINYREEKPIDNVEVKTEVETPNKEEYDPLNLTIISDKYTKLDDVLRKLHYSKLGYYSKINQNKYSTKV